MNPTAVLDLTMLVDGRTGLPLLRTETTTPEPSPSSTQSPLREDLDAVDVSPGLPGFLAIFFVALVTIFLVLSMTRKLRKVHHRANNESRVDATFDDRRSGAGGTARGTGATPDGEPAPGDRTD